MCVAVAGADYQPSMGDKYKVDLEALIAFLFPKGIQHPLVAGRLFVYGLCGPLDSENNLKTGFKGSRVVLDYELEEMCLQIEREDLVSIYLHNQRDLGLLSSKEQEMIIGQADGHLKKAKGKASLPILSKQDIYDLFRGLPRDSDGLLSFHDMQQKIVKYREARIKEFKLVFPSIGIKASSSSDPNNGTNTKLVTKNTTKKLSKSARVSDSVAPTTMFQRMKGENNADIVQTTTRYLSKFAYQLSDIDQKADVSVVYNVRLIRDVPPYNKNPYKKREKWNDKDLFAKSGVGSKVDCAASSTTFKQKVTIY